MHTTEERSGSFSISDAIRKAVNATSGEFTSTEITEAVAPNFPWHPRSYVVTRVMDVLLRLKNRGRIVILKERDQHQTTSKRIYAKAKTP